MDRGNEPIIKKRSNDVEVASTDKLELPEEEGDLRSEELRRKIKDVKEEMELAHQKLIKKKDEIAKHSSVFRNILWNSYDLGETDKESEYLENYYEELKLQYDQLVSEYEEKTNEQLGSEGVSEENDSKISENAGNSAEKVDDMDEYGKFIGARMEKIQKITEERQSLYADQDRDKNIGRLKELQESFRKLYIEMLSDMADLKNTDPDLLNMDAEAYVSEHGQGKAVKIFNSFKETIDAKELEKYDLDPRKDEIAVEWMKRFIDAMMKNLSKK
jgi:hypothetical protein